MNPWLAEQVAKEHQRDLLARAERDRLVHEVRRARRGHPSRGLRAVLQWPWFRMSGNGSSAPEMSRGRAVSPSDLAPTPADGPDGTAAQRPLPRGHGASRLATRLDDCEISVAKVEADGHWATHEHADEFFFVTSGRLVIRTAGRTLTRGPGEFVVVPHGVAHYPMAQGMTHAVLIESGRRGRTPTPAGLEAAAHPDMPL